MAKFDSATVVEPLDWTFEGHVKGAKGTVREPADQQIADYLAAIKKMTAKYKDALPDGADGDNPADLVAAMDDLDPQTVVEVHAEMAGIYSALCSGEPSKELLLKLPLRVRVMFYGWLQQEVMSPEAAPGAGSGSATTLQSAAAG